MGAVETKSKGGKYVKPSVRNAIKRMAYMSQIAKCVTLLPTPEDFATQVIGEVIVLMGKIKDFSIRINDMMETYTNFPSDFLAESTNNIMSTLTNYANVATIATQGMVDTIHGVTDDIDYLTTSTIGILTDQLLETNDAEHFLGDIVDETHDGLDYITSGVNKVTDFTKDVNDKVNEKVQSAIDFINETMKKINDEINNTFSDYIISIESKDNFVDETQKVSESMNDGSLGGELLSSVTDTVSTLAKNFNIGKIATGFLGISADIGLVAIGLDKLPQLNLDNVLAFGKAKVMEAHERKMGEVREYQESEEYKNIVESVEPDKKTLRDAIRKRRKEIIKDRNNEIRQLEPEEREAKRSAAKEVRKAKLKAKKAKIAQKMKETIGVELTRFQSDLKMFGTNIKDEWTIMQNQYKEAVEEIKKFFTGDPNEAPGSKYIDDCCDAIEKDCDSIKEIFKNLSTTITVTVAQIPAPTSVGTCFDFALYKVLRWFECAKVILIEIIAVINYGLDIIKQIDNLVKIILNTINNVKEIKEKLMEILNIKWLLDLIDSFMELFMGKCLEAKELVENMITPIYYNETDEYDVIMKSYEDAVEKLDEDDNNYDKKSKNLQEKIQEHEDKGEDIIAYKSPLLTDDGSDFKGWIFYHENIDNRYKSSQFLKQFFSRLIIKRAVKTGNRKKGGVNMLKDRNVFKVYKKYNINSKFEDVNYMPKAYDAFYWYTKYTTDPNDDELDTQYDGNNGDIISPVMTTENGTLVELEDGRRVFVNDFGIRSGDYVLVEGKRYRVR
jgi:prefoldin subunit 5